ncbi:hypothetical protein HPB51_001677 [Rhipicephalus microplus]|uniref:Uncharacterized protein n=1 Tax=Rhipicephalus microplus TaxID=6941 RepID=A0A9J6EWU8_RHIMP|nr:hypothetical protein HPB51_001677 [Rhipicephalus microplus]
MTLFVKPEYVAYDALLVPVQPSKKKKLFYPAVSAAPLDIDQTPVPAPNQTFVASVEKLCRSRTDSTRPSHECTPHWALCGSHIIGDRCCEERYRVPPFKPPSPSSLGQTGRKKRRHRRRRKSGSRSSSQVAQPTAINPALPPLPGAVALGAPRQGITTDGPPARTSTVGQPCPPHPN